VESAVLLMWGNNMPSLTFKFFIVLLIIILNTDFRLNNEPSLEPFFLKQSLTSWPRPVYFKERLYAESMHFSDVPSDTLPCPGFQTCPWYEVGTNPSTIEWNHSRRCNPYSRLCSCFTEWLGSDKICPLWAYSKIDNSFQSKHPPSPELLTLGIEGWLTDWPFEEGVRRCSKSICNVVHNFSSPNVDARVFSGGGFLGKSMPPYKNGKGVINVGVSVESPNNIRKLDEESFPFTMHFGVSHRRGHLDLHTTYNNYFPAQFRSKGAPFLFKKDSLLFLYSSCFRFQRNQLFDELSKLISIDSLGNCKTNKNINELFPDCAKFPRSGSSAWLQSECLLHNYKFYLAIENVQEPDYITEKLYQGLRSGSVPVYLGAPNIRDFLPLDSAVFIEDFPSLEALVQYLNQANADEKLYNRHLAWKDLPFPGRFVNSAIEKPLDSVYCQICDHIAANYGTELPLINDKGRSVVIPPCITRMLIATETTILRDTLPSRLLRRNDDLISVYGTFLTKALNAFEFLQADLNRLGLSFNLVTSFDADLLIEADRSCWNPSFTEFTYPLDREVTISELSLAMKQTAAMFDVFRKGYMAGLIITGHMYVTPNFVERLTVVLSEAPIDWDFIIIGGCRENESEHRGQEKVSANLWRVDKSLCSDAYLVSENGVNKALNHLPIIAPIDIHIQTIKDVKIFWAEGFFL